MLLLGTQRIIDALPCAIMRHPLRTNRKDDHLPDIYARLGEILADILDGDDVELRPDTTAADVEGWDSLNNIRFMSEIESVFGVRFTTSELTGLDNVGALVKILEARAR